MHHDLPMNEMPDGGHTGLLAWLLRWLAGNGYAPHSGCFLGDTRWVTAYVAANWVIALAYTLVAILIAQRMRRAAHIPKTLMGMALFGIFVTCAVGHFLAGITTVLWPGYRFETLWHWVTAVPAWVFLAHHRRFSLIVEGPHMIAETREELARKNDELQALYAQVKHLDALKSQFFANVSHELRTPLALVLGPLDRMLRQDNLTPAQRADLELAARNARIVLKHVNDLLDIAKMESDRIAMRYEEADVARLVRVTASNFETVAEERGLMLDIETPTSLTAQIDVEKIQRILLNLVSNALKFVPAGGHVRCLLTFEGDRLTLTVEDNGPGIPVELREAVFDRFRQVDGSATRQFGGTGLGLAIVKDFVELHGGTIGLTETPGGGARFAVTLPMFAPTGTEVRMPAPETEPAMGGFGTPSARAEEEMVTQALEELRVRVEARAQTQETGQPLVLVVEDNPDMARFVAETLQDAYRVEMAGDGEQGLERALELRPELIVSDVMMPRRSGDQMVRDLRAHEEMDGVPILMLTAKADNELRVSLLRDGAQDYVMKPFRAEELLARAANLIGAGRARALLQGELASRSQDLATLAAEITERQRLLQAALHDASRAQQVAEQTGERLHKIQTVTDAALAHLDWDVLLRELMARVRAVLPVEVATIVLLTEDGQEMVIRATQGARDDTGVGARIPVGYGLAGRIIATGTPLTLSDATAAYADSPLLEQTGIRSMAGVPLRLEGRTIGVLHVGGYTPRVFSDDDIQLLQLVADRAAFALDHARLYAREQERNEQLTHAIQEAHHRIKNNLQAVTALLEMEVEEAPGGVLSADTVRDSLRQIKTIALVHDLLSRDTPIGDVDAAQVLASLSRLLEGQTRGAQRAVPIYLVAEASPMPAKVATSLALIVNELVGNALKHSAALTQPDAAIRIELRHETGELLLAVEDPGPGFPADFDPARQSHIGLDLVTTLTTSDLQGRLLFQNVVTPTSVAVGPHPMRSAEHFFQAVSQQSDAVLATSDTPIPHEQEGEYDRSKSPESIEPDPASTPRTRGRVEIRFPERPNNA